MLLDLLMYFKVFSKILLAFILSLYFLLLLNFLLLLFQPHSVSQGGIPRPDIYQYGYFGCPAVAQLLVES